MTNDEFEPRNEIPQLLTVSDLTDRLKVTRMTIHNRVQTGKFPAPVRIGRSVRWRADEISAWLESESEKRVK